MNSKMECAIIILLCAVTVAVPVPEGEGYSEVGRMGLQLGQVLSRVEAQQEEMSKRLDELNKTRTSTVRTVQLWPNSDHRLLGFQKPRY